MVVVQSVAQSMTLLFKKVVHNMKEYIFTWTDELYLIHVQFNCQNFEAAEKKITIIRSFTDGSKQEEFRTMTNDGFRFIISRTCPEENGITIIYEDSIVMKVFLIDDRAYYPTESYFEG